MNFGDIDKFLHPTLANSLPDPSLLKDMDLASQLTVDAIIKNKNITILGDYDVDGISSASLFKKFFDNINVNSFVHITDRFNEGYGVSIDAIKKLYKNGVKLVISVDCGIQSFDSWDEAKKLNIESSKGTLRKESGNLRPKRRNIARILTRMNELKKND